MRRFKQGLLPLSGELEEKSYVAQFVTPAPVKARSALVARIVALGQWLARSGLQQCEHVSDFETVPLDDLIARASQKAR
ncbi:MAG TPA: hypothetical protein VFE34_04740 [Dongiaceae bacterium]|nr:hypothetical protein [Dongiaceae bacterium]